jgi:hypothetical protein
LRLEDDAIRLRMGGTGCLWTVAHQFPKKPVIGLKLSLIFPIASSCWLNSGTKMGSKHAQIEDTDFRTKLS